MKPDAWLDALTARHAGTMTRSEFLKAVRALSARYVERRGSLPDRSPLDSAGKRAAFAGFYAPLHFLTTRAIVAALGPGPAAVDSIVDLGCGTGVCGAALAVTAGPAASVTGIDLNHWALDETQRNWRELEVRGRTKRANMVAELTTLAQCASDARRTRRQTALIFGWSLNELDAVNREHALGSIAEMAANGTRVLVIEPVAGRLVPWFTEWSARCQQSGARVNQWRFEEPLPAALAELDREAGFNRDGLTARSVALNWS